MSNGFMIRTMHVLAFLWLSVPFANADAIYTSTPGILIPDLLVANDVLTVPDSFIITDLNVLLDISHTLVGDLRITLTHVDSSTAINLMNRPGEPALLFGCLGDDIDAAFDDEGLSGPVETMCGPGAPAIFGTPTPDNPLSAFDGLDAFGEWRLTVRDLDFFAEGTLNSWSLHFNSTEVAPVPEPASLSLYALGLAGMGAWKRYRAKR